MSNFYLSDKNIACSKVCLKECFKVDYEIEKTVVQYPSLNYLNFLRSFNETSFLFPKNEQQAEAFAKKSLVKLMVNYKTIEYTLVEEIAQMPFEVLLGNIGGQLGLFIGISLLSLIEIFQLLIRLLLVLIRHFKRKNSSTNTNNDKNYNSLG